MTETIGQGTSGQTILLIDDEKKLLLGLEAVMRRAGFTVYSTTSGTEGLSLAQTIHPDAIICDVMMPPPNGFEIKRKLAVDAATANIPFIFLTARTFSADKIAGLNLGADDYITKPFNIEELLARLRATLRRNELGRQSGLKEAGQAFDKLRDTISSNLAHEMRTPLNIIMASLELALREKYNTNSDDMRWYLDNIQVNTQKLTMLVTDLLILNDIDQHKTNKFRKKVDLQYHFMDPIKRLQARWSEKGINTNVYIEPDTVIYAPEVEFSHMVAHLADNAFKFSPDGRVINIELRKNGTGGCKLTIQDEGEGIPLELREKVFERFYQVHQGDTRQYPGLGLGLTISRAVAEAVGGSVTILGAEKGCKVRMIYPPGQLDWVPSSSHRN